MSQRPQTSGGPVSTHRWSFGPLVACSTGLDGEEKMMKMAMMKMEMKMRKTERQVEPTVYYTTVELSFILAENG